MSARPELIRRQPAAKELKGGEHLHPLIQQIYLARGITDCSEVDYRLHNLCHPDGFKGLDEAAALLHQAITQQQRVVIVGDFDADGATSTALMIRALRQLGAEHVDFVVPNRFEYGYGLSVELVDVLVQMQAELVVTVDNGISSFKGVAAAKDHGMTVIITDHHLPPPQLPAADAIVNPNCEGDEFPSKALAGVGVAFYLLAATKRYFSQQPNVDADRVAGLNLANLFDLVAVGTVADLVPLDRNNRILVNRGLELIKNQRCTAGVAALFEVSGIDISQADNNSLGFYVAPRLNAAGRLEDMSIGINLLLTDDVGEARKLAQELQAINQQRKQIQADMQVFADSVVKELRKQELPQALCLFHKNWHQGVVGLLASRVKEDTHRPVIAFALEAPDSEWVKGSARSIKGLHIRDALVDVDSSHPGLIKKFGGHAMAAGLTMKAADLKAFKKAFIDVVADRLSEQHLTQVIHSDGPVDSADLSLYVAEMIQSAGPWGQHFDEPLFDDWFVLKRKALVGENHTKLQFQTSDGRKQISAIAFNHHPNQFVEIDQNQHVCYQMMVNEFRDKRSLQLKITHIIK